MTFSPTIYNVNNPGASLTLNGSTSFVGCSGVPVTMNFTSDQVGNPFDICFGPLAAAPIVLADDLIELDLPNSYSVFGGACASTLPVVGFGFGTGIFGTRPDSSAFRVFSAHSATACLASWAPATFSSYERSSVP